MVLFPAPAGPSIAITRGGSMLAFLSPALRLWWRLATKDKTSNRNPQRLLRPNATGKTFAPGSQELAVNLEED
jgi:hypothetical protein